jgi:acyl-CoA thioester hydrolase
MDARLGYGQERMRAEHGMVFAVRSMQMDFIRPASWTMR